MTKDVFNKMENEWFNKKPKNFRSPESEKLEINALQRERSIILFKNSLLQFLNNYSNEIPEKLMSGPEAIEMGIGDSKYRPNSIIIPFTAFDPLLRYGILSNDFKKKYVDFADGFEARRSKGGKVRTTKEEIDALDDLIRVALKELEEKGY